MAALRPAALATIDLAGAVDAAAPVARAVDAGLRRAVAAGASDLHVEPLSDGSGRTRLRIDGIMHAGDAIARDLYAPLVSRIKLLASLDISNRRLPQDGRYSALLDSRRIDVRVSSIPTIDGEKLVLRLLDHQLELPRLDDLGFGTHALVRYRTVAHAPWFFVVVSGPTGM